MAKTTQKEAGETPKETGDAPKVTGELYLTQAGTMRLMVLAARVVCRKATTGEIKCIKTGTGLRLLRFADVLATVEELAEAQCQKIDS